LVCPRQPFSSLCVGVSVGPCLMGMWYSSVSLSADNEIRSYDRLEKKICGFRTEFDLSHCYTLKSFVNFVSLLFTRYDYFSSVATHGICAIPYTTMYPSRREATALWLCIRSGLQLVNAWPMLSLLYILPARRIRWPTSWCSENHDFSCM
jgi:hypothetical protein